MGKTCCRCKKYYKNIQKNFHRRKEDKFKGACKECIIEEQRKSRTKREEFNDNHGMKDDRAKYGWKWGE